MRVVTAYGTLNCLNAEILDICPQHRRSQMIRKKIFINETFLRRSAENVSCKAGDTLDLYGEELDPPSSI
jgi:hypothetical protein